MNRRSELEGVVRSWLREDEHEDADRVLITVLDQLDATPQRHAGWLARRFPIMQTTSFRLGIAAVVAGAAALLGANLLPGTVGQPDPTPTPQAVAPTPPASAEPLAGTTELAPGSYVIDVGFPVRVYFTVPSDGWYHFPWEGGAAAANVRAICTNSTCDRPGAGIGFHIVTGVPADACRPGQGQLDVGPTIEDLADAIRNRAGWTTTDRMATTLSGFPAVSFEIRAEPGDVAACADGVGAFYSGALGRFATPGERLRLWVVDVDGTRLVIEAFDFGSTPDEAVAAASRIVESIVLQPLAEAGAGGAAEQQGGIGMLGKRHSAGAGS